MEALGDTPIATEFPNSTAVARAAYRPRHRTLDLWWRLQEDDPSGRRYRYFDVPPTRFDELLAVSGEGRSVGEFCNLWIKPCYDCVPWHEEG